MRTLFALLLLVSVTACGTRLVIDGEGSVLSRSGDSDCTYEDHQADSDDCKYNWLRSGTEWDQIRKGLLVPATYTETYYAIPKRRWAVDSMILAHQSQVPYIDSWSFDCKQVSRNDCPLLLSPAGVKSFVDNGVNPILTTKFIARTNELTVNSVFPSKVYAAASPQRIIFRGEGFLDSDVVTLTDLSDAGMVYTTVPVWRDNLPTNDGHPLGLIVIEANFSANPSRWLLKVSRADNSESFTFPFDVVDELDTAPFLGSPIDDSSCASHPCSPYEAVINSVMDHSGTPLDLVTPLNPATSLKWRWFDQDDKVLAFTGELGQASVGTTGGPYPGYKKNSEKPFLINGAYKGGSDTKYYLNYDGHSGYDYNYASGATMRAPAEGYLFRASSDTVNGGSWDKFHAFYILHENGMTTWFLHAQNLDSDLTRQIGTGFSNEPLWVDKGKVLAEPSGYWSSGALPSHLHFEVRKGEHEVVDPYADRLWENASPDTILADGKEWLQPELFTNLSWEEMDAVCPMNSGGVCGSGTLNGHDMTGWKWASTDDLNDLFNSYDVTPPLTGSENRVEEEAQWATAVFVARWRPTQEETIDRTITGYTSNSVCISYVQDASSVAADAVVTGNCGHDSAQARSDRGGWFFREAAPTSPLNDTGIKFGGNYPSGNNAGCTGVTIDQQDCSHGRDATNNDDSDGHAGFSYTKLSSNGTVLPASATSWACVRDNITGLVWEMKTTDGGIHDWNNTYRWGGKTAQGSGYGTYYPDWNTLVDGSNSEALCGFPNGWRVPTRQELQSIVNYNRINPSIDPAWFPNTSWSFFWSASPSAGDSSSAWFVHFYRGYSNYNDFGYRGYDFRVRLVRAGQ